jgi:hypothetical protein
MIVSKRTRIILLAIACIACLVIALVTYAIYNVQAATSDFNGLLSGNESVSIVSMQYMEGNAKCVLSDPDVMEYVNRAIRSASTDDVQLGPTRIVTVRLSTGRTIDCTLYTTADPNIITIGHSPDPFVFDSTNYYTIRLADPIPPLLDEWLGSRLLEELGT